MAEAHVFFILGVRKGLPWGGGYMGFWEVGLVFCLGLWKVGAIGSKLSVNPEGVTGL